MTTITHFQVVQQTATELSIALQDIQNNVQRVSPQDPLASCYTVRGTCCSQTEGLLHKPNLQIFRSIITRLRDQVLKGAADTAECEYLIHLTYLQGMHAHSKIQS